MSIHKDEIRDAMAKAMCAVETRSKAATLEEVASGIQRWTRHRYEAECLIGALADYGIEIRIHDADTASTREAVLAAVDEIKNPFGRATAAQENLVLDSAVKWVGGGS